MKAFKNTFLNINFQQSKGMILEWNFAQFNQQKVFFHHLIVLMTPLTPHLSKFLTELFKKTKQGDLLSFLFIDFKGRLRHLEWVEKILVDQSPLDYLFQNISKIPLDQKQQCNLFQKASQVSAHTSNNLLVDFILQKPTADDVKSIQEQIKINRTKGAFPYICFVMGQNITSDISISKGINVLDISQTQQTTEFYHKFVNFAALKSAKVGIECIDRQMTGSFPEWMQAGFHKIERRYYGPSVNYSHDLILLMGLNSALESHITFRITLKLTMFSQQVIFATKYVRIELDQVVQSTMSALIQVPQQLCFLSSLEMSRNPYESQARVYLTNILKVHRPVGVEQSPEKEESCIGLHQPI